MKFQSIGINLSTGILFDHVGIVAAGYNQIVVFAHTGTGRYQVTANHILLHTFKRIDLTLDSGLVEDLGGLLERCCRDEARCLEGTTGNTLENLLRMLAGCASRTTTSLRSRCLSSEFSSRSLRAVMIWPSLKRLAIARIYHIFLAPDTVVFVDKVALVYNLLGQEVGIACIEDSNLAHHLTHDYFEVLVVDLHTLHTVYILYFVHDVFLYGCRAHDIRDVGRGDCTVRNLGTGTNYVVLLYKQLLRSEVQGTSSGRRTSV